MSVARRSLLAASAAIAGKIVRLLCDRVVVMKGGRIVEAGPAGQVMDNPADPCTRELLAAAPQAPARGRPERKTVEAKCMP